MSASSSEKEDPDPNEKRMSQNFTPSLRSINRRSSYNSLDSNHIRAVAIKFGPKKSNDVNVNSSGKRSNNFKNTNLMSLKDSLYRRERIDSLEMEYSDYLQQFQGFFIIRCQMMNIELSMLKEKGIDLDKVMRGYKNLRRLQREIRQENVFKGM